MQRLGLLIFLMSALSSGFAMNEFGEVATVKKTHPDFFRPGVVSKTQLNGEDWYVYAGDAEKCFKEETDAELYEEATVQAKMNFFNHFAKQDPKVKVQVVGALTLYRVEEGTMRITVLGVPVKNVTISTASDDDGSRADGEAGASEPVRVQSAGTNEVAVGTNATTSLGACP